MPWLLRKALNFLLWLLVRYAEKRADEALSDDNARKVRRYIENRLHELAIRKQKGATDKTKLDDRGLRFVQIVMKSKWLECAITGDPYPCH